MQFSEEKAIVSHVDGDFIFLETSNSGFCSNCSTQSGCGKISSLLSFKPKNKLRVENTLKLIQGDTVIVGMKSDKLLRASVLMYLAPLLLFFLFAVLAKILFGETASIIAGVLGLSAGLLLVKKHTQQKEVAQNFQPQLIRKIIDVNLVS